MQVLNHESVVNPIEGFGEVHKRHDNGMRFSLVNSSMDKMEESNQVMGNGRPSKATTVGRIKERFNYWEKPVTQECFVYLAKEWGAGDVP